MHTPAIARNLAALTLAAAAMALGGCYGYNSWPPVEGDTAINDVNFSPSPTVMAVAMKFVADRYPPVIDAEPGHVYDTEYAINLPEGASVHTYFNVAQTAGPAAHPLITGDLLRPTYHVSRINVRGTSGSVDIIRPIMGVGGKPVDPEAPLYQGVTVYLSSGASPWHVTHHRTFPIGMFELPRHNPLPEGTTAPYLH